MVPFGGLLDGARQVQLCYISRNVRGIGRREEEEPL